MTSKPRKPKPDVPPVTEDQPADTGPAKPKLFKQPLTKPQPWQFGGRGPKGSGDGGSKPQKDAERRGGKSRKVH